MLKKLLSLFFILLISTIAYSADIGNPVVKGTLTVEDSNSVAPVNLTERSSAPSAPASGDIYLDDGSNTASGEPGLRRYTGSVWEDISSGGSGGSTVYVNTAEVSDPDFTDTATVEWTVDGSEVTANLAETYLKAEADTLDSVTGRGATTTNAVAVGGLTIASKEIWVTELTETAIIAAIDLLANDKGIIRLVEGTYVSDSTDTIVVPDGVTLVGAGSDKTLIDASGMTTGYNAIEIRGRVVLKDFGIFGSAGGGKTVHLIYVPAYATYNTRYSEFTNLKVYNSDSDGLHTASGGAAVHYLIFKNCEFTDNDGWGTDIATRYGGNYFYDCIYSGNGSGAMGEQYGPNQMAVIDGCSIKDNTVGIEQLAPGSVVKNTSFTAGHSSVAIQLTGADGGPMFAPVVIENCVFKAGSNAGTYGIVGYTSGSLQVIISNCSFFDSLAYGIRLRSHIGTITNCVFVGGSGPAIWLEDNNTGTVISNCFFKYPDKGIENDSSGNTYIYGNTGYLYNSGSTGTGKLLELQYTADGGTDDLIEQSRFERTTSGTPAAGFGTSQSWYLEEAAGNSEEAASVGVLWTDATDGSEDSKISLKTRTAGGAIAEAVAIESNGMTVSNNGNACKITVDTDGTCDAGTKIGEDNSIAICAVCS